jgi:hypothetical protein
MAQFSPHSIKCPRDIELAEVTAMCEFKETLFLGYGPGILVELVYVSDSTAEPYRSAVNEPISLFSNPAPIKIIAMHSIQKPSVMLVHYELGGHPSVVNIFTRELSRERAPLGTDRVSLLAVANDEVEPFVVVANDKKFSVWASLNRTDSVQALQVFEAKVSRDAGAPIQAIGVSKSGVVFYAGGQYRGFWFETSSFFPISTSYVPSPFVLQISDENFLIGQPGTMIITGKPSEKTSKSIPYNNGLNFENRQPEFLLWYRAPATGSEPGRTYVFEFFNKTAAAAEVKPKSVSAFRDIYVPRVRKACRRYAYELNDLLLLTDEAMYTVGGTSPGTTLATLAMKGGLEVAAIRLQRMSNVKDQQDVLCDMFKDLWVREKVTGPDPKLLAMQIVSKVLWQGDVREILSLFPFLQLPVPLETRVLLSGTQVAEQPQNIPGLPEALGTFLLFTDNEYKISNDASLITQVSILDTALFEFYAVFHQTRYLDAFMKEQNSIDLQVAETFLKDNLRQLRLHPARAIFCTNTDKIPEALKIWGALNDHDSTRSAKWAFEASYTLQLVRQHRVLDEHLGWIKNRSMRAAVNALLYPSVEVPYAREWIQANCPTYMLRFYDFIVQQTGPNTPNIILVQEALQAFCDILMQMEFDQNFNLRLVSYSDDALDAPTNRWGDMVRDLARECANKIARIVRRFGKQEGLSLEPFVRQIEKTRDHSWLLFELFAVGEMYEEAISIILETNDFQHLQEFCRTAPNSRTAFGEAFRQLGVRGRDILENGAEFLIRNIEWLDCTQMLDWIPEDQPIANVTHILAAAESYLVSKARVMQMKVNVAESMDLDVEYRLVKAQLRNAEVHHNTICQGCRRPLGDGWLAVAPDNRVYHMTCKPKLAPR